VSDIRLDAYFRRKVAPALEYIFRGLFDDAVS